MRRNIKFLAVTFIAYALLHAQAYANEIRGVAISGSKIAISAGVAGPFVTVADDGTEKELPVWSKDGTRIAYIEKNGDAEKLSKLVVIDPQGQVMSSAKIKPVAPGEIRSGMRYVESVEWISNSKIVVAGGVNPTTTEYNIVDMSSGKTVNEFFDDGSGASFSPNGQHFAYVTGAPHFTPASYRLPTFKVDGKSVSIATQSLLEFMDVPIWSSDSNFVAVLVKYATNQSYGIAIAQSSATTATLAKLPFADSAPASVYWAGRHLYVSRKVPDPHPTKNVMGQRQFLTQTYKLQEDASEPWSLLKSEKIPEDSVIKAKELRSKMKASANIPRGSQYDFWCKTCELSVLPRRATGIK